MRQPPTRLLRRALLAVVIVVTGAVAWNLRRTPAPASEPAALPSPGGEGTSIGDLSFFRFHGGEQKVEVRARAMSGEEDGAMHLQGVEVRFPFTAEGRPSVATVTADECLYDAGRESAQFRGNVHVETEEGFELDTESLAYDGARGRVASDADLRFRRGRASGTARGMVYHSASDELQLDSNVHLQFEDAAGGPATEVHANKARSSRRTRMIRFQGDVVIEQGPRTLRSKRLLLTLDPELKSIVRATAIGAVDARLSPTGTLPGEAATGHGERRLRCRRLDVDFRAPGVLEQALAARQAVLELLPGSGDALEKRTVRAQMLQFLFDEQGRLETLFGRDLRGVNRPRRKARVVLTSEPVPPARAVPRRVECIFFSARIEPGRGTLRSAELRGDVTFAEGGRKAWSQKAEYDEGTSSLTLTGGGPRVHDEAEGSDLQAERIRLGTVSGEVQADDAVRHTIAAPKGEPAGGLFGSGEPTVVVSGHLDYDPDGRTARYRDNVLLRSGRDEIRASRLLLEEPTAGQRRVLASGGTTSLLHPRPRKGQASEPSPVLTSSREMVYEEKAARVVYTGDVEIRQGDILTLSPRAVVTLTPGGDDVEKMVAGEPVEVRQGVRRATGRTGTYTLADETLVLVGDEVVLQDADRRVKGRALTFKVGEDRIRIDGREEVRTEAVFEKRDTPNP